MSLAGFRGRFGWLAALILLPASAQAHITAPGINSFTAGLLHPWMTPAHILILLAVGLWLGQNVPLRLGPALKVFAPLAALALACTATKWITGVPSPILVVIALTAGAIVALAARIPSTLGAVLLAAAAIAIGLDSGADNASAPLTVFGNLSGTWVSLNIGIINLAYYASLATERKKQWINIGLRIVGSWIVAISLLMLAFALRPAHPG